MRMVVLWMGIVLLNACSLEVQDKVVPQLWDASVYFQSEITRLNKAQVHLRKELMFNDSIIISELNTVDWDEELAEFKKLDLNTVKNKGNYSIDSLLTKDSCFVYYRTQLVKLTIQELTIAHSLNAPQKITVKAVLNVNTNLYQSHKTLTYHPLFGYSIEGNQAVLLGKQITFGVNNSFIYF